MQPRAVAAATSFFDILVSNRRTRRVDVATTATIDLTPATGDAARAVVARGAGDHGAAPNGSPPCQPTMDDSLYFTDHHLAVREMVRGFATEHVQPIAARYDASAEFPWESIRRMGELGLLGVPWPEDL